MTGFYMHSYAVRLFQCLHETALQLIEEEEEMDITMVYDRPILLCRDVLKKAAVLECDHKQLHKIVSIQNKYSGYDACILAELDVKFIDMLCNDLKRLWMKS